MNAPPVLDDQVAVPEQPKKPLLTPKTGAV